MYFGSLEDSNVFDRRFIKNCPKIQVFETKVLQVSNTVPYGSKIGSSLHSQLSFDGFGLVSDFPHQSIDLPGLVEGLHYAVVKIVVAIET